MDLYPAMDSSMGQLSDLLAGITLKPSAAYQNDSMQN